MLLSYIRLLDQLLCLRYLTISYIFIMLLVRNEMNGDFFYSRANESS